MFSRAFFLICLLALLSPANAQDAIIAKITPHLDKLDRAKTLRGIKYAENAVADDLEQTARDAGHLTFTEKEREEHVTAFFKRARFCYRALTLLFEKKDFPRLAKIYSLRAGHYNEFLERKISRKQFIELEKENEAVKMRALTLELAALEKSGPPNEGTVRSLERMGNALGQIILQAAGNELGGVPEVVAFNQGMMALQRDDHANAAKHLLPLAERGDPRAQFWMGHFHRTGQGLPQNLSEAVKWLQRAANQQEPSGQYLLGSMYFKGEGVPRDLVTAYMWFSLATAKGDETATKAQHQLATHMTGAQIAEAKKRASEWKPATRARPALNRD